MRRSITEWVTILASLTVAHCGAGADDAGATDGHSSSAAGGAAGTAGAKAGTGGAQTGPGGGSGTGGAQTGGGGGSGTGGAQTGPGGGSGTGGAQTASGGSTGAGGTTGSADGGWGWVDITPPGLLDGILTDPNKKYGFQSLKVAPSDPRIVYLGTTCQGVWRTTDFGATWEKRNQWWADDPALPCSAEDAANHVQNLDTGRQATMAIDPTDSNIVYTTNLYGCRQGVWKTTDGGLHWSQQLSNDFIQNVNANISSLAMDPKNRMHLLAGSRMGWLDGKAGFLETLDGGQTWIRHDNNPSLDQNNVFFIDSQIWIVGVLYKGYWRTPDSGQTWQQVSTTEMSHGTAMVLRAPNDVLYLSGSHHLQRSVDNGVTWASVGPVDQDEFMAVESDGNYLYTCSANTGKNTIDPDPPYYRSPIDDGTTWTPYTEPGILKNGPAMMGFDPVRRILYSANWAAGVFKLQR